MGERKKREANPEVMTIGQAAFYMGVRYDVVRHLVQSRQLRHTNIPMPGDKHDRIRIRRVWIDEYMNANGVGGPEPAIPLSSEDAAIVGRIVGNLKAPAKTGAAAP